MRTTTAAASRSRLHVFLFTVFYVAASILMFVALTQPAAADSSGPVIPPPGDNGGENWCTKPPCNNPDIWIDYTCKNGNLMANGKLYIEDDPRCQNCPNNWWDPARCDWQWDYYDSIKCLVRFEVFRFYGTPDRPAQTGSHSQAHPRFNCVKGDSGERFIFHAPHPHDAGVAIAGSAYASHGVFTTTSSPLSGTRSCPVGDDPANLRQYFAPASSFKDDDARKNAALVRSKMRDLFNAVKTELDRNGVPQVYAYHHLNSKVGLYRYPGDTRDTVQYSDGLPCSSGLDFLVRPGQQVRSYGVCWVPVVTQDTVKYVNNKTGETKYLRKQTGSVFIDREWMANPKNQGTSGTAVTAYRNAIPDKFKDPNVPCHYGQGSAFDFEEVDSNPPPATPRSAVTKSHLAYVYGSPDLELKFNVAAPTLTCGSKACKPGTQIVGVNWNKPTVKTPTGSGSWAACSSSNRTYCAYTLNSQKASNNSLAVQFRGYKATPAGQKYTLSFSGTATIRYPISQQGSLSVCLSKHWTGLGGGASIPCLTVNLSETRYKFETKAIQFPNGNTAEIRVAGSRLAER